RSSIELSIVISRSISFLSLFMVIGWILFSVLLIFFSYNAFGQGLKIYYLESYLSLVLNSYLLCFILYSFIRIFTCIFIKFLFDSKVFPST
ncbi:MAG: hypothetical protein V3575_06665, partial [Candidatus Absconditabacteria bacterium]